MSRVLRRLLWWTGSIALLFWVLTVPPVIPWWPSDCDIQASEPLRTPYVDQMAWWFDQNNVRYGRWGNRLFLRILPAFDGTRLWSREWVINNGEWKGGMGIRHDTTINGVFYPTPEAVKRIEALPPPDPADMEARGERICALFRAAVLEDPY